jgi:hypothetical protein
MIKPRWQLGLEELAAELRAEADRRRRWTPADPAADALDQAAAKCEEKTAELLAPTRVLTPAEYGAEQEPPVHESTVRRWCDLGELDHEKDGKLYRIPAGARRRAPERPMIQRAS